MEELGHILREARETKGLTLQEVQQETRINTRYLEALENGNYESLPTPVHVRGFLRNYARFLGLDPQPLLDRYEYGPSNKPKKIESFVEQTPIGEPLKEPPTDQHFFDPVNMEVDAGYGRGTGRGSNRSETIIRLVIIVALIGLIYLAGQRFIPLLTGQGDGTEALTEEIQEAVEGLMNQGEESAVPEPTADLLPSGILTSTSRNNFNNNGGNGEAEASPISTRPPLPATMEQILLEIFIQERAWMEVT
ncbi:MAG: helix-turn-helix domain-containing protein, partial [Oceanospirillum sp.]|nr:helix-turn-helix domain-containing protein [Oceanospirillum sp.]